MWGIDCTGEKGGNKKVDLEPTAIMKARDDGGLDCGGRNEGGKMSPNLDVFCRRSDRIC